MCICLAEGTGIEPVMTESKSVVLPLHQPPTKTTQIFKEHWLDFVHLMFPAQRFAFLRALRFETTEPLSYINW
jgi:hypothetical protein